MLMNVLLAFASEIIHYFCFDFGYINLLFWYNCTTIMMFRSLLPCSNTVNKIEFMTLLWMAISNRTH